MICPITFAKLNEELEIVNIIGSPNHKKRLLEKGLIIGGRVLVQESYANKLILKSNDIKFAINFGLANKIMVK